MPRRAWRLAATGLAAAVSLTLCVSCGTPPPPDNPLNACDIFADRRGWWDAARDAERRWTVPAEVLLAIINQESSFTADARPPRRKFLWVLPGARPSTAYGYAQATNPTWEQYKRETGRRWADRDNFRAAADFVGWYTNKSHKTLGIARTNARAQYLAYHEGWRGYSRRSYADKPGVLRAAARVERNAARYGRQLELCRRDLDRRFLFIF